MSHAGPSPLRFEVRARLGAARLGRVSTPHGGFETPAFMPVATKGTLKGILPAQIRETGTQVLLNNTYHLLLRPGDAVVERLGGVHRFMRWDGPILTDSGGFQAFSLAHINRLTEAGVTFKSIVDGSDVFLSPERAIEAQNRLGPDIIMAFDDCPPTIGVHATRVREAHDRTVRWLDRCIAAHGRPADQALFGIVQGGLDLRLRAESAREVTARGLSGYAIGGVAVGEGPDEIAAVVGHTAPMLPNDRPRYLMGVGYERDILAAVKAGVDMFDCVLPTRNGRNANAFTAGGQIRLRNARFAEDAAPIEADCDCPACGGAGGSAREGGGFSRGYLRHLFMAGEMLGPILVSLHNVRYYQRFMAAIRRAILEGDWTSLEASWPGARAADNPRETAE